MKDTEILKVDKRGRIVIPRMMRKVLGLKENSQIMAISDSENKEIRLIPLTLYNESVYIRLRIRMKDVPGSLARIAQTFGELGLSLVYGESVIIKKGIEAEWTVIAPPPENMSLEELKQFLISHGDALDVQFGEQRVSIDRSNSENKHD